LHIGNRHRQRTLAHQRTSCYLASALFKAKEKPMAPGLFITIAHYRVTGRLASNLSASSILNVLQA
jgi:hypothetical protein